MKVSRLHHLDYLRGLAAFGIMTYHLISFGYGDPSTDLFIKRLGFYGVSVFYVLSGLTLFHVYRNGMQPNKEDVADFFIKRGFRILPLLWVVTFATMLVHGINPGKVQLLLNLTGLFGLVAPSDYIGTGVWSIGNELVFYLFFPLFMLLYRKNRALLALSTVILLGVYCYFAFYVIAGYEKLTDAWHVYINPLNQVFLFLSGFLVGIFFQRREVKSSMGLLLIVVSLLVFTFYPVSGDPVNLISGIPRMVFSGLCILICIAAYKITYRLPSLVDRGLGILGEISYSLYLLHPIVWVFVEKLSDDYYLLPLPGKVALCTVSSILLSFISFQYFERPFIRLGRKISNRLIPKLQVEVVK